MSLELPLGALECYQTPTRGTMLLERSGTTRKSVLRGTHRTVAPSETLTGVRPYLEMMGITRIANVTGLDQVGIPTVLAFRPNARSLSVTQGKGLDLDAATASAVMEAAEHYHAEYADLPLRFGCARELSRHHTLVDIERLPKCGRAWNERMPMLWAEASNLLSGASVFVPHEIVHLDFTLPLPQASGCFPLGSNGLASGNTFPEAVAHALWELIERDALALFYRMSAEEQWSRRIDLCTIDEPSARELIDRCQVAGLRVALWDVTSDVGVATVLCAIVEDIFDPWHPIGKACGSGCHAERGVAVCRAVTEAAQSRLTRITGSRDDIRADEVERLRSPTAILRQQAELAEVAVPPRRFPSVPSRAAPTFDEDLEWTCAQLAAANMGDVLVVDLSCARCPVSVVRAVVPGLEGSSEIPGAVPGARAAATVAGGGR